MKSRMQLCSALTLAFAAALTACTSGIPATRTSVSSEPVKLPDSVHWFRDSAEQQAAYLETFRAAENAVRHASGGLAPRTWAVILDVDETILDNSDYQKQQALAGLGFQEAPWNAWVARESASRLPGAKEFIDAVLDELKGQVVLVTNRKQELCAATEENLHRQQIRYDRILCDVDGQGDKNPRFRIVMAGTPETPGLAVLAFLGDNIQDFPNLTQAAPGDLRAFGVKYFVLPNPMYGSWMNNRAR